MTYYSLGVTISFCKLWFENDTLIQVRYWHLLGIWYVFVVDMLFSSVFFLNSAHKIYVDIYLKIFRCILVYPSDLIIWLLEMFHVHYSCISNMKNIKSNIQPREVSVVNAEMTLKVKRVMLMIFLIELT